MQGITLLSTACSDILRESAAELWSANAKLQGLICLSESTGCVCVWEGFLETAGFARSSSFPVLFGW